MSASDAERALWRDGIDDEGWIHMNAAGASPQVAACHDAMVSHLQRERTIGAYAAAAEEGVPDARAALAAPVSYTHLTLPTICSV